jgi:phosphotransferase system enzyme I (PtsP)
MGWRAIRIGLDPAGDAAPAAARADPGRQRPAAVGDVPDDRRRRELLGARKLLDLELDRARRRGMLCPSGCVLA